jgi:hypothetical protein
MVKTILIAAAIGAGANWALNGAPMDATATKVLFNGAAIGAFVQIVLRMTKVS